MKVSAVNQPVPDVRADLALVALALMWGTSHVITKSILATHTPFYYTSGRFGLAALCFGLLFAGHLRRSSSREVRQGALLGLCSFAGISCYSVGLVFTQASKAGFITGMYLVFTPLLAYVLFRLRPGADNLIGLLVAVVGFGLLSYPRSGEAFNWGDLLILGASLCWAAHIAATSVFARQSDARTLAAVQVIVVAVLALTVHLALSTLAPAANPAGLGARILALEARPNVLTMTTLAQIGYMAVLVTFVAALVQTWAQGKVAPTHAAILYALEPVTAAVFAWLAFGEKLSWRGGAGALLIILGVLISRLGWLTHWAERDALRTVELAERTAASKS